MSRPRRRRGQKNPARNHPTAFRMPAAESPRSPIASESGTLGIDRRNPPPEFTLSPARRTGYPSHRKNNHAQPLPPEQPMNTDPGDTRFPVARDHPAHYRRSAAQKSPATAFRRAPTPAPAPAGPPAGARRPAAAPDFAGVTRPRAGILKTGSGSSERPRRRRPVPVLSLRPHPPRTSVSSHRHPVAADPRPGRRVRPRPSPETRAHRHDHADHRTVPHTGGPTARSRCGPT